MGHAAMIGEEVPAPGGPRDLDALTYPPRPFPTSPDASASTHWSRRIREIEVAKGVFYPAWTYNGTAPAP